MTQEYQELYQERQQRIELAVERAEKGIATKEDFDTIRFECGLQSKPIDPKIVQAMDEAFLQIFKKD